MTTSQRWVSTAINHALLLGAIELEQTDRGTRPHRLPAAVRAQWPDPQLLMVEGQPSGMRLAFRTTATAIALETIPTKRIYVGMPPRPDGVYDLLIDGQLARQASVSGGDSLTINMSTGSATHERGAPGVLSFEGLPAGDKTIEIWLPHDETTELVDLRTNAPVEPIGTNGAPIWLHHGSSISHGSNASHPTGTWPAIAATTAGVSLINLGFGGSAIVDPFVARTIRDTKADLISIKLGINVVNTDAMRLRAFGPAVHGFLDTIREGHKTTPILLMSPIYCPIHEDTPGPTAPDFADGKLSFKASGDPAEIAMGKLTLNVIRDTLNKIVTQRAETDSNIHYLDGRALYGEADNAALPLPDRLHPDGDTHRLMGERFAALAFAPGAPLAH